VLGINRCSISVQRRSHFRTSSKNGALKKIGQFVSNTWQPDSKLTSMIIRLRTM
jgi:hypothetical protein